MSWFHLDDGFVDNRKVADLTDSAFRLYVAGIAHCARNLTDGLIHDEDVPRLVRKYRPASRRELVASGLWVESLGHVLVHDYLDWNDSRERVMEKRQKAAKRRAAYEASRPRGIGGDA
jgi:hypothetical protein